MDKYTEVDFLLDQLGFNHKKALEHIDELRRRLKGMAKLARHNDNCCGDNCQEAHGEVRVLPAGGDANMILCLACFNHELDYRRERNKKLSKDCQFDLPDWQNLRVYET